MCLDTTGASWSISQFTSPSSNLDILFSYKFIFRKAEKAKREQQRRSMPSQTLLEHRSLRTHLCIQGDTILQVCPLR